MWWKADIVCIKREQYLNSMSDDAPTPAWRKFEQSVADALTRLGWLAELTPASNDFGADIIAACGRERLVVQCKFFADTTPLQSGVIREVMVAKQRYRAKLGLVAYRGVISKRTFEYAMQQRVAMLTLEQIVNGCFYDKTPRTLKPESRVDQPSTSESPSQHSQVVVVCRACGKMNRLPVGRDGIMKCGHCRTQSFQRT